MPDEQTDLLIIGAGPYGLALSAYARHLGLDHVILGRSMEFWRAHMPEGMYLRSASDWHLDPLGAHTIDAYAASMGLAPGEAEPISRVWYLDYAEWFRRQSGIEPRDAFVERLDVDGDGLFRALLASGETIRARKVVLAIGFGAFRHVPDDLAAMLPQGRYGHTRDEVDLDAYRERRCVIVGGRQSAYEWAALLREAGAAEVHIVHRQAAPAFAVSEWAWVTPLVDAMVGDPGSWRRFSQAERDAIVRRLYAEGRLKLEPWLAPRIERDGIHRWPHAQVTACVETDSGDLQLTLDTGQRLVVDHVILATGYRVRIESLPLLASGNILPRLDMADGYPVLSERFETSVPGLFITSMPATQAFGPYLGFTIATRMSAQVIGDHLVATGSSSRR